MFTDKTHKYLDTPHLFIGISGIIGVGKSILCEQLFTCLPNSTKIDEPLNNDIEVMRKMFYNDMKRWSLAYQIKMFNHRLEHHKTAISLLSITDIVQDRTIFDDPTFAIMLHDAGLMTDEEFKIYKDLFEYTQFMFTRPDIMFFLYCEDINIVKERIKERNRSEEQNISDNYLIDLQKYTDKQMNRMEKLGIQCFKFEWSNPNKYVTTILHLIEKQRNIKREILF